MATRQFAEGPVFIYNRGGWGPHVRQARSVPRWVVCSAKEFEQTWLPKFERKELPACTDEQWSIFMNMLRQSLPATDDHAS